MRSKQMLMGAAVIGCLAATMTSEAYAQEANTIGQSNARTGQQPSTNVRPMRQRQDGNMNAKLNAGATSNRTSANGQLERHGFTNKSRMNGPTREGRGLVEGRAMRGERGAHVSVSDERYGQGRGWRGERRLYARAEGGYDRGRFAYRERAVGVGAGVAAADYGYRARRLYAYAPTYDVGYTPGPDYSYAPRADSARFQA